MCLVDVLGSYVFRKKSFGSKNILWPILWHLSTWPPREISEEFTKRNYGPYEMNIPDENSQKILIIKLI